MSERLQKLLARNSFGSRREVEEWITAGRVKLNGKPAALGDRYEPGDRLVVDGRDVTRRLDAEAPVQVVIYHKPQGQPVLAQTDQLDASVVERLPALKGSRWLAVNRMQPDDSGLLLMTNNGELANALMRTRSNIFTAYMVRVHTPTAETELPEIPLSFSYAEETVEFSKIETEGGSGTNHWYRVEMNRMDRAAAVRDLFASCGLQVSRTSQVAFATLSLPRNLPRYQHRALTAQEMTELYVLAGLRVPKLFVDRQTSGKKGARGAPRKAGVPGRAAVSGGGRGRRVASGRRS